MKSHAEAEFKEYVAARSHALWHTAYLMCGDPHYAEDLVQMALMKLYRAWHRVERADSRDGYVRTILTRCVIDEKRRSWHREQPMAEVPEPAAKDPADWEERDAALQVLARLPARQRATLVLRFWEDQSVEQTAHALGCSTGTVRSQTARGLATLRALLEDQAMADSRVEKGSL